MLSERAKKQQSSIGSLIRYAIQHTYRDESTKDKRSAAIKRTMKERKRVPGIDYKELIADGRKH